MGGQRDVHKIIKLSLTVHLFFRYPAYQRHATHDVMLTVSPTPCHHPRYRAEGDLSRRGLQLFSDQNGDPYFKNEYLLLGVVTEAGQGPPSKFTFFRSISTHKKTGHMKGVSKPVRDKFLKHVRHELDVYMFDFFTTPASISNVVNHRTPSLRVSQFQTEMVHF